MSLLPRRESVEEREERGPRLVDIDEDAADEVFAALSSATARSILAALYEDPHTASDLAAAADTSLQNTRYHLDKLEDAGLVEVVDTWYSERGTEMPVYAPTDDSLVVFAGGESGGSLRAALASLLGGVGILGLATVLSRRLADTFRVVQLDGSSASSDGSVVSENGSVVSTTGAASGGRRNEPAMAGSEVDTTHATSIPSNSTHSARSASAATARSGAVESHSTPATSAGAAPGSSGGYGHHTVGGNSGSASAMGGRGAVAGSGPAGHTTSAGGTTETGSEPPTPGATPENGGGSMGSGGSVGSGGGSGTGDEAKVGASARHGGGVGNNASRSANINGRGVRTNESGAVTGSARRSQPTTTSGEQNTARETATRATSKPTSAHSSGGYASGAHASDGHSSGGVSVNNVGNESQQPSGGNAAAPGVKPSPSETTPSANATVPTNQTNATNATSVVNVTHTPARTNATDPAITTNATPSITTTNATNATNATATPSAHASPRAVANATNPVATTTHATNATAPSSGTGGVNAFDSEVVPAHSRPGRVLEGFATPETGLLAVACMGALVALWLWVRHRAARRSGESTPSHDHGSVERQHGSGGVRNSVVAALLWLPTAASVWLLFVGIEFGVCASIFGARAVGLV